MNAFAERVLRLLAAAYPYQSYGVLQQDDWAAEEAAVDTGEWVEPWWLGQDQPRPD
jgi:hypothetical protein